ncbi:MAG: protein phosphatase CheZ [Steroidobacteraceae bacterium]
MKNDRDPRSSLSPFLDSLCAARASENPQDFVDALASFNEAQDLHFNRGVREVATDIARALKKFCDDSRLVDLAEKEVPNARHRLAQVIKLTDEAAHRTLDLVERCAPRVEAVAHEASQLAAMDEASAAKGFLMRTVDAMNELRQTHSELLLAQSYQDLTGQIIRSVMTLVEQLECALRDLVEISGLKTRPRSGQADAERKLAGPAIPGVNDEASVSDQSGVDDLLGSLGL